MESRFGRSLRRLADFGGATATSRSTSFLSKTLGLLTLTTLQVNLWWSLAAVLIGVATLLLFLWLLGFDVLSSSTGSGYGLAYR